MMKSKLTPLATLTVLALLMSSCSSPQTQPTTAPAESTSSSAAPAVQVDEGLLSVDITIRRSLLDPEGQKTDEELVAGAREQGMKAAVNGDSVTYTMTRSQQRELLAGMRASMEESITTMVNDTSNSFTAIEANDDLSVFTVKVDPSRYSELESLYVLAFYMQGGLYQQFSGTKPEDLDVTVEFVDDSTGETLNSGSMREWMNRMEEQRPG